MTMITSEDKDQFLEDLQTQRGRLLKELGNKIRKNGFDYEKVKESKYAYIYAQRTKGASKVIAYEVFQRRENKPYTIAGIEFPASVAFPSNENFGSWAFTYRTLASAERKFRALNAKGLYAEYPDLCEEDEQQHDQEEDDARCLGLDQFSE
jgi:hypothetical protein